MIFKLLIFAFVTLVLIGFAHDLRRAWEAWMFRRDQKRLGREYGQRDELERLWDLPAIEPERSIR